MRSGRRGICGVVGPATALFLLVAMVCLASPTSALASDFTDVSPGDWFADAVGVLSDQGIIKGSNDGTFRPYDPITRAEFSVLLARILALTPSADHPFGDFPRGDWFEPAVGALYQAGLTAGVSATVFDPHGLVSRQQAATFVMRALEYRVATSAEGTDPTSFAIEPSTVDMWLQGFPDRGFVAEAHKPGVASAYRLQVVVGKGDGRFYPLAEVTRAQSAGILYAALHMVPEPLAEPPAPVSTSPAYPDAGLGGQGPHVLWLEQRLAQLTYRPGAVDGVFDTRTRGAVMAFQKWEGLSRNGQVGPSTWSRLAAASRPVASQSASGTWIEVSLPKQVFLYIQNGVVTRTLPTSTGASFTYRTSPYVVQRKPIADGARYKALYLEPGNVLAIHGYPSVPTYPASNGCVRVHPWDMDDLRANDATNPMIPNGTKVYIR